MYPGNLHCIEMLLAAPGGADLLFAKTRSGWMCASTCRLNLRSHAAYSRNPILGTLASLSTALLASRPIHNVCIKHSPAYALASSLVPHLLHLMRGSSGVEIGEMDRPHGFNEKNNCDLELLAEVTRPASLP